MHTIMVCGATFQEGEFIFRSVGGATFQEGEFIQGAQDPEKPENVRNSNFCQEKPEEPENVRKMTCFDLPKMSGE